MTEAEDAIERLRWRLDRVFDDGDKVALSEPSALLEAEEFAPFGLDNIEVAYLLGTLHWERSKIQPDGSLDREAAMGYYSRVFGHDPGVVPRELWPTLARSAPPAGDDAGWWLAESMNLLKLSDHTEAAELLDRAICLLERAAGRPDEDGAEGILVFSALSQAFMTRFAQTRDAVDFDAAARAARRAVESAPPDPFLRASALSNLSNLLRLGFEQLGRVAELDQAVAAGREAVSSSDNGPGIGQFRSNLALALRYRSEITGAIEDLTEAVHLGEQAVNGSIDDRERAKLLNNLGNHLQSRYHRFGDLTDLDRAVAAGRESISLLTNLGDEVHHGQTSLAGSLQARFLHTGQMSDLDEAVGLEERAAAGVAEGHPNLGDYLSNLSNSLRIRFDRSGELADLDRAIEYGWRAVAVTPPGHPRRPKRLSNVAGAMMRRFEQTNVAVDLDRSVDALREAVAETAPNQLERSAYLSNLSSALRLAYVDRNRASLLDEAIEAAVQAVAASPHDKPERARFLLNLGEARLVRFRRTRAEADRLAAVEAFAAGAQMTDAPPDLRLGCSGEWTSIALDRGDWSAARQALAVGLALLPLVSDRSLGADDRHHHLLQMRGLGPLAAYAEVRDHADGHGDLQQRAEKAWLALEAGRGMLISQSLEVNADLTALTLAAPDLAGRIFELRSLLGRAEHPDVASATADDRRRASAELQRALGQARKVPGLARFGLSPTMDEMRAAAGAGTVVAILLTAYGCGALLLNKHRADYLPLPGLTESEADEQAKRFVGEVSDPGAGTDGLLDVLRWVWDRITGPVLDHLGHRKTPEDGGPWPRVWWLPTGNVSLLPLHAAGHLDDAFNNPGRRTVLDRVVSSYTPTVRVLANAGRTNTPNATALVVGLNQAPDLPPLSFAETEARVVAAYLDPPGGPLLGTAATRAAVVERLGDTGWVHLACHAMADNLDPARSFFALADGHLTVRELGEIKPSRGRLAFLSACTTATTSTALVDEPIHLATAFLLTGFQQAIGTLWSINDAFARLIAEYTYENLGLGFTPAEALHRVIRRVRAHPKAIGNPRLWASHIHFGP